MRFAKVQALLRFIDSTLACGRKHIASYITQLYDALLLVYNHLLFI